MMKNKKLYYGILAIVILILILIVLFINYSTNNTFIKTMTCYDYPNNLSGKHELPIPYSQDSDCDLVQNKSLNI